MHKTNNSQMIHTSVVFDSTLLLNFYFYVNLTYLYEFNKMKKKNININKCLQKYE